MWVEMVYPKIIGRMFKNNVFSGSVCEIVILICGLQPISKMTEMEDEMKRLYFLYIGGLQPISKRHR